MPLDPPQHEYQRAWHLDGDDVFYHPFQPLVSIDMSQCSWHKGGLCPTCLGRLVRVVDEARRQLAANIERQYKGTRATILNCAYPDMCSRHGSHEGVIKHASWSHEMGVDLKVDQFCFAVEVPDSQLENKTVYALRIKPIGPKEWKPKVEDPEIEGFRTQAEMGDSFM